MTIQEIGLLGEKLYRERVQVLVETPENLGKRISIDVLTGDFEVDVDPVAAALRLQARHPDAALYGACIGRDHVYTFGTSFVESKQ